MSSHNRNAPPLAVLIALSAIAVLPLNMFVPSLPGIARDLGVDFATANLAVAGYAVATALTHLIAGALSDRLGRKPVLVMAMAVFTVASIGCALATDIVVFLICRLFQAAAVAGYAVSLAAIRDVFQAHAIARIGYVSSAWAVAPMVGPALGGVLDDAWGWSSVFFAFALFGAVGLWLSVRHFPETHLHRSASAGWSLTGHKRLLQSPRFWGHALCMAFASGTLYVFLGAAPLVGEQMGHLSGTALGIYMGLVPAGFMVGSYAVGRVGGRWSSLKCMLAGRFLTSLGLTAGIALVFSGSTHPLAFFGPCICVGLGNGLTLPAANARVLSLDPGMAGTASGLASAITMAGAGSMAFLAGLLMDGPNVRLTVLIAMLTTAFASLAAASFIARIEK